MVEGSPFRIIIPAVKKSAVIPDQLVKRLAGTTLIQRAIDTAKETVPAKDILVVTDSDEIRLVCLRNGVDCDFSPDRTVKGVNIVAALQDVLLREAEKYRDLVIYRASSPLVRAEDIEDAYERFTLEKGDCLVTLKDMRCRYWKDKGNSIGSLLFDEEETSAYVETKALFILRSDVLKRPKEEPVKAVPYFLGDHGIEISGYQDWWLCEKILAAKHIVFVVAGYAAIGMGHVFRALMLAHEIGDHRVSFLCTRESELAARDIAAKDYATFKQESDDLADDVLKLKPDLVINDILNTGLDYMEKLKAKVPAVVNFEDEGPGAAIADLVVNALYQDSGNDPRVLAGWRNFCLRDEFQEAARNEFRERPQRVLITFGGTDHSDYTRKTLEAVFPECLAAGLDVRIVSGPGYEHRGALAALVEEMNAEVTRLCDEGFLERPADASPLVSFTHATNVMSRMMEGADFAICSAGRTVYELTHMRVPSIVMSHHEREDMHTFARPRNGFIYLGVMSAFDTGKVQQAFSKMLNPLVRKDLFLRMSRFDFSRNKEEVVRRMLALSGKKRG